MIEPFVVGSLFPLLSSPKFWIIFTCIILLLFKTAEKLDGGDKHE